jgi:hypothetical protein
MQHGVTDRLRHCHSDETSAVHCVFPQSALRLSEEIFESSCKLNNSVIPLSSDLNRLGLSFKASTTIDSSQPEENGGVEMARLPLSTIAYACTTRTDTQNALYSIQNVEILRFQLQWNY